MSDETARETPALPAPIRDVDGRFVKGSSGNPAGRQPVDPEMKGKHELTHVKRKLEIAVRNSVNPEKIKKIVEKMCDMAADGNVRAAKLILDKVISNASDTADDDGQAEAPKQYIFKIENATFAAIEKTAAPSTGVVIDVEATPVDTTPSEEA